jgi:hypothetical protein
LSLPRIGRPSATVIAASATLAVIAVSLSWYTIARYSSNSEYLLRRNFRVLAVAGRQLQGAVGDVAAIVDAHVQEVGRWKTSQSDASADAEVSPAVRPPRSWALANDSVVEVFTQSRDGLFGLKPPYVEFESCLYRKGAIEPSRCRLPINVETGRSMSPSTLPSLTSRGKLTLTRRQALSGWTLEVRAEIDLARAIQPFLVQGVFDSVVLAIPGVGGDGHARDST